MYKVKWPVLTLIPLKFIYKIFHSDKFIKNVKSRIYKAYLWVYIHVSCSWKNNTANH